MQSLQQVAALRALVAEWRGQNLSVGLVPTMGSLHDGHRSLVKAAKARFDRVIVTIFVNPTQFSPGEDFDDYPRVIAADKAMLVEDGADAVFLPTIDDLYPRGVERTTLITISDLTNELCGAHRDGHFDGAMTAVNKLLNITRPDAVFLGEKDFQQLFMMKQMVSELMMSVEVIGVPTYREDDGLAMSSRNKYLTETERDKAKALFETLSEIEQALKNGSNEFSQLEQQGLRKLQELGFIPDYIEVRRQRDMLGAQAADKELVVLGAAKLGKTRLIDNIQLSR
ncbi:MAG: pantoate--beta-alanine ligase [Gammaproteobacteria bacterium]|nr:pantoate--beta-alanine ligase [Gammaproteobacteria bacterium]